MNTQEAYDQSTTAEFVSAPWPCDADAALKLTEYPGSGLLMPGDYILIRFQDTAEDMERVIIQRGDLLFPAIVRIIQQTGMMVYYPLRGSCFIDDNVKIVGKIVGISPAS